MRGLRYLTFKFDNQNQKNMIKIINKCHILQLVKDKDRESQLSAGSEDQNYLSQKSREKILEAKNLVVFFWHSREKD